MKWSRWLLRCVGRISFLRFAVKDHLIRFFHNPHTPVNEEFITSFFNKVYRGNFNTYIDWYVYYFGAYTLQELVLIKDLSHFTKRNSFLDIGANIGHHSLFASSIFKNIYAVEPFPEVYKKMEEKIRDNNSDSILVIKYALGERNESAMYYPPQSTNTGTGSFVTNQGHVLPVQLEIRNGDEIIQELNIEDISFIKIDTEGFEAAVLTGLHLSISKWRPFVLFEWSQGAIHNVPKSAGKHLFPPDYSFFQVCDGKSTFLIFDFKGYRLKHDLGEWEDGMWIAVPNEYFSNPLFVKYFTKRKKKVIKVIEY